MLRSNLYKTNAQTHKTLTTDDGAKMSNHTSRRLGKGSTKLLVHGEDEISSEYLSVRDSKLRPLIPTMGEDAVSWSHHDATTLSKPHQKCVRFDRVEVREYPIELGSSIPTCGAPLGIAWSSISQCSMTVDDYEKKHPDRRDGSTLVLPSQQRLDM